MSSLLGGLASLERWEGLKEWHRRHQDILGERGTNANSEVCSKQLQPAIADVATESRNLLLYKDTLKEQEIEIVPPQHDLSIIPEADEDSRSRDGDLDAVKSKQGVQKNWMAPRMKILNSRPEGKSLPKPNEGNNRQSGSVSLDSNKQDSLPDGKVMKRPFLRKGQGLVKYNIRPEELKHPYRKGSEKANVFENKRDFSKPNTFASRDQKFKIDQRLSVEKVKVADNSKAFDLAAPMQRLVLPMPAQRSNSVEIGTWSQVLCGDLKSSATVPECVSNEPCAQELPKQSVKKPTTINLEPYRHILSPPRKTHRTNKSQSSPEEDQESLAAYLDLEQHVGNASFCSTSSKVDRLVAKSTKPAIHQSNPDAITQTKQLTPVKTGRKFFSSARDNNNVPEDNVGMWSTSDLDNLIKARARRSGSLIKSHLEPTKSEAEKPGKVHSSNEPYISKVSEEDMTKISPSELVSTLREHPDIDWMLEAFGPARKPHLMKTMSGIDLDSSLIKNALAPTLHEEEHESDSDTESSSSSSSSEEDFEDFTSGMDGCSKTTPPKQPSNKLIETSPTSKEVETVSHAPFKLVDDSTLEEINNQIELHLSTLRREIETLQSAKTKTQKYTASLEKKVQDLEHRLVLEARSFNKRLEDEREAAAKRLSEEQGKLLKEKQALQRTLREERRKAPDPITQQELLNMKQEIAQWEEKWRSDRAKARGLESNLRIQITNLRRENERLKEENNKLKREKETVLSTAKAKAASNTRVINSIAQQLGNNKPKVTILREENPKAKVAKGSSAYNLKSVSNTKDSTNSKPIATIDSFPKVPYASNEWSTDEEIDLGKESSDEDDISDEVISKKLQHPLMSKMNLKNSEKNAQKFISSVQDTIDLEEAQAKYDAMFGGDGIESDIPTASEAASSVAGMDHAPVTCVFPSVADTDSSDKINTDKFVKTIQHPDGKVEQVKEDGTRVITHPDGTWKRHSSSGSVMTVPPSGWPVHISYFNGDQLEKLGDGVTRYFYAKTGVWQTTYPDGHEELRYPSGQVERREKDGSVKVVLPGNNGQLNGKLSSPHSGSVSNEISVEKLPNGDTIILLPNGERELHTPDYMKKEFLDGTVKFLFQDGSQETQYPSGRIRVKDAQGNLVRDTSLIS